MTLQDLLPARAEEAFRVGNRSIDHRARPGLPRLPLDPHVQYRPELPDRPQRQFLDLGLAPASAPQCNQPAWMEERSPLQIPLPPVRRWKRNQCSASSFRNLPAQPTLRSMSDPNSQSRIAWLDLPGLPA